MTMTTINLACRRGLQMASSTKHIFRVHHNPKLLSKSLSSAAAATNKKHEIPEGITILYGDESLAHELRELTKEEKEERAVRLRSKRVRPTLREERTEPLKDWQKIFPEDFDEGEEMAIVPLPPLADENGQIPIDPVITELADRICKLSLMEVSEVVAFTEARLAVRGIEISAHNPLMMSGGGGGGKKKKGAAADVAKEEEKTEFEVKLTGFDAKAKIKVIKEIRSITGLGLKEAKALVEGAPASVKANLKKEDADEIKKQLEDIGGTVEIA